LKYDQTCQILGMIALKRKEFKRSTTWCIWMTKNSIIDKQYIRKTHQEKAFQYQNDRIHNFLHLR
jgi:hypothetical protein